LILLLIAVALPTPLLAQTFTDDFTGFVGPYPMPLNNGTTWSASSGVTVNQTSGNEYVQIPVNSLIPTNFMKPWILNSGTGFYEKAH